MEEIVKKVLNLIINGLPSIHTKYNSPFPPITLKVLNLIINGLPSILDNSIVIYCYFFMF